MLQHQIANSYKNIKASVTEKNWSSSFWGTNYPRLSKIKEELDPNMIFWVSPGINANYAKAVDGRQCLVNPVPNGPSLYPPPTDRHVIADLEKDGDFLFGHQELIGTTYPSPGTWVGLQPAE